MNKVEELEKLVTAQAETQEALTEQLAAQAETQKALVEQIKALQETAAASPAPEAAAPVKAVKAKVYLWSKKDCNDIGANDSPGNEAELKRQGYKKGEQVAA